MRVALRRSTSAHFSDNVAVNSHAHGIWSLMLVLLVCFGPPLRAQTPAPSAPSSRLEQGGSLEVLAVDRGHESVTKYYLNTGQGRVELPSAPSNLQTGAPIRVRGNVVSPNTITARAEPAVPPPSTPSLPASFGNQTIAVLLVNFMDDTSQHFDATVVQDLVFTHADAFYRENSQNQAWLSGQVFGYFTLPISAGSCNIVAIGDLADQAALKAGVNVATYAHVLYVMSEPGCGFEGAAYLGGNRSWSNTDPLQARVVAHELGHNLGLYHAHALNCSPNVIGTNCTSIEYGDVFDIMGDVTMSHFGAYEKERLQYLNAATSQKITLVVNPGTYDLEPYEDRSNPNGVKALKILKQSDPQTGTRTFYYIEYRQPIGFDADLATDYPDVFNGVVIRTGADQNVNSSFLLDMNPQTPTFADAALPFGERFVDPGAGITITAVSGDANGAQVKIDFSAAVCKPAAPVVTISPSSQTGTPGTELDYNVTITNADTAGCDPQTFALVNSAVPGWTAFLSDNSATLAPGDSASTMVKVTSPSNAAAGNYKMYVKATGNKSGFIGFAQLTYSIGIALTLSVDSSSIVIPQGQGGFVTLTTAVGGGFNSLVSLSFSGVPSGVNAALSATSIPAPGAGKSILTFTVPSGTALGSYTVIVTASGGGLTSQAQINLTVNSSGDFTLAAAPTQVGVSQGSTGDTTITSTLIGVFNSSISLVVMGTPAGVTASFVPSIIPAPGSGKSTLTFTVGPSVPTGSYPLTVTGTSGVFIHSISLTLLVSVNTPPNPGPNTPIPQTNWRLKYADSQELSCASDPAIFAFDGKPATFWQTESCLGTPPTPHEIQIDLGASYPISGFKYLPRQDGSSVGKIKNFEFYVSSDGQAWGSAAATGILISTPTDVTEKLVSLSSSVTGRYVRLRALSEVSGGKVTSVAELNVLQSSTQPPPAGGDFSLSATRPTLTITQGASDSTNIVSTLSGSFSSSIALSLTGAPSGVTSGFTPATIAAPGSGTSSLTLHVSSSATVGTYSLTVTGQGGTKVHSITVTLTVNSSSPPPVNPAPIPQTAWKLKFADSQELNCGLFPATFAFDGKPLTMWQTQSCIGTPALPHEIQIDLGAAYSIKGFRYLPRQDSKTDGKIALFEFYVSSDGVTWGTAVVSGTLITTASDVGEKQVLFNSPVNGRYVRLRAISEVSGLQVTSMAELNVLQ